MELSVENVELSVENVERMFESCPHSLLMETTRRKDNKEETEKCKYERNRVGTTSSRRLIFGGLVIALELTGIGLSAAI